MFEAIIASEPGRNRFLSRMNNLLVIYFERAFLFMIRVTSTSGAPAMREDVMAVFFVFLWNILVFPKEKTESLEHTRFVSSNCWDGRLVTSNAEVKQVAQICLGFPHKKQL